jgi:hypothetical protein
VFTPARDGIRVSDIGIATNNFENFEKYFRTQWMTDSMGKRDAARWREAGRAVHCIFTGALLQFRRYERQGQIAIPEKRYCIFIWRLLRRRPAGRMHNRARRPAAGGGTIGNLNRPLDGGDEREAE